MKGRVEKKTKLNFHFIKEVRFYDRNNDVVANTMLYDVNGGYTHFEARAWHNLIFFFRSPMVACVIIFIRGAAAVIHILQCGRT